MPERLVTYRRTNSLFGVRGQYLTLTTIGVSVVQVQYEVVLHMYWCFICSYWKTIGLIYAGRMYHPGLMEAICT